MTPLQQLSALIVLASAVGSLPFAAPPAAVVATASVPAARRAAALTPELAAAIRDNARRATAIDPPMAHRQVNWGGGSCAWASMVNLLHWQGLHQSADYVRSHYEGGAGPDNLYPAMDRLGIPYAAIPGPGYVAGDERFLEWCCRTRRGACVPVGATCNKCGRWHWCLHMENLVGIDAQNVYLLDNDWGRQVYARDRANFMYDWKQSGGWAFTIVGTPPPPKPWRMTSAD